MAIRHARVRGLRGTVALVTAVVVGLIGTSASGASTFPWTTFGTTTATAPKSSLNLVLVGDSLLVGSATDATRQSWVQGVANNMANRTGRTSFVSATPGASWVNYGWAGQEGGNSLLWDLAAFLQSRLTVAALATNDARIMTEQPTLYNQQSQYSIMAETVRRTLLSSRCVLLVNVAVRDVTNPGGRMSATNASRVNANMQTLRSANLTKVHVADWNTYSRGQTSWFKPNDVHLTDVGSLKYYDFIATRAAQLVAGGC